MRRFVKLFFFLTVSFLFLLFAFCFRCITLWKRTSAIEIFTARITQFWGKVMLAILGIYVETQGIIPSQNKASFFVCNHQSYVDIIVLASIAPMAFVAKGDVKKWFLLGWLASLGGTIFVNRKAVSDTSRSVFAVTSTLQKNISVLVFPEATSTNGFEIRLFKPLLFSSAVETSTPVVPVVLRYSSIDHALFSEANNNTICWYGTMEFVPHFLKLLNVKLITVSITFLPSIEITEHSTPRLLAEQSYTTISEEYFNHRRSIP